MIKLYIDCFLEVVCKFKFLQQVRLRHKWTVEFFPEYKHLVFLPSFLCTLMHTVTLMHKIISPVTRVTMVTKCIHLSGYIVIMTPRWPAILDSSVKSIWSISGSFTHPHKMELIHFTLCHALWRQCRKWEFYLNHSAFTFWWN